ncbi:Zinc finger protein 841 [Plakobranchus ocellatus]|uniref:Zinc finger protein 841 n=1 Tax=Plakobranchus ocellatus TaxID=259542 RepID=A0AAV4B2P9_9GAST|nr:Zinc finger protein 841 [Plakobranchus ocellatus]
MAIFSSSESCNEESSALLSLEEVHALLDQKGMAYCLWCTSKRKGLSEYIHHVTSQHHDVQPVVCSSCGQVFAHHASFLAHIPSADTASSHYDLAYISKITKTLGGPSVRSSKRLVGGLYECRTCKKKFRQSCSLFRHRWKCEGTRSFTCKICDGVFYRRDHFKRHLLNSHGVVYQANPR